MPVTYPTLPYADNLPTLTTYPTPSSLSVCELPLAATPSAPSLNLQVHERFLFRMVPHIISRISSPTETLVKFLPCQISNPGRGLELGDHMRHFLSLKSLQPHCLIHLSTSNSHIPSLYRTIFMQLHSIPRKKNSVNFGCNKSQHRNFITPHIFPMKLMLSY